MKPPQPPTGASVDFSRLEDVDYRRSIMLGHAMRSEFYRANTAVTEEVYDIVYADVLRGVGGTVFSGTQRVGKTHCSYVVFDRLKVDIPDLAIEYVVVSDDFGRKYDEFCRRLLSRFGHNVEVQRKYTSWEQLVLNHVRAICLPSGTNIFFLLGDEAQRWQIDHYRHLFNLGNYLAVHGYRLATILFAQRRDVKHLLQMSIARDHQEITGRFFVRPFDFRGILSELELRHLLDQYDSKLFYPLNADGWSYTRFYANRRYQDGWRLADEAPHFWRALVKWSGAIGELSEASQGIGMNWIAKAIHHYLLDELMTEGTPPRAYNGNAGEPLNELECALEFQQWYAAIGETVNELLIRQ